MPTTVGAVRVSVSDIPITLDAIGTATPTQTAVVRTQINGQLQRIGFTEGQFVQKGQFLAQVDARPYEAQVAQAQGQLARDQAQLNNARLDLQRYQTLLAQDSIARQQVDTQAALVRQYEGTLRADQASINSVQLNVNYARIVAPLSGRVGLRQVDVGNFVTAGDANGIVSISQVDPMDVVFAIPQDTLPQIARRLKSGAVLPATALDQDRSAALAQGRLLTFDNAVDVSTGTVRAKARFPNGDSSLFPNQFVNVRLVIDTLRHAVTAPSGAVLRGARGAFVYVVDLNTRKAQVRTLKTGASAADKIAVLEGLQAGEVIVTDGTDRLREGACVILPGDRVPNMGAGGGGGRRRGGGAGGPAQGGGGAPPSGGAAGGDGPSAGGASGAGGAGGRGGAGRPCPNAGKPWNGAAAEGGVAAAPGGVFGGGAVPQRRFNAPPGTSAAQPGASVTPDASAPASGSGPAQGGRPQATGGPPATGAPAAQANASAGGGGGGQGRGGGGRMLEMLGLDPQQKAKAQAIFARHQPSDPNDPDARREARQAAMAELMPVLRPDQKAKLDAFRAQMRARGGFGGGGGGAPE